MESLLHCEELGGQSLTLVPISCGIFSGNDVSNISRSIETIVNAIRNAVDEIEFSTLSIVRLVSNDEKMTKRIEREIKKIDLK